MGDFNETTKGKAVQQLEQEADLVNLAHTAKPVRGGKSHGVRGTYRYKGRWEQLDQIIVSPHLAERLQTETKGLFIYDAPYLLEKEPVYGGFRPYRTFNGLRYKGGYSDHLPIYADFGF